MPGNVYIMVYSSFFPSTLTALNHFIFNVSFFVVFFRHICHFLDSTCLQAPVSAQLDLITSFVCIRRSEQNVCSPPVFLGSSSWIADASIPSGHSFGAGVNVLGVNACIVKSCSSITLENDKPC